MVSSNKYAIINLVTKKNITLKELLKQHLGKTQYLSLIRTGKVALNDEVVTDFSINITPSDQVKLYFKRQKLKEKIELVDFSSLDILFEDEHVLIINKEPNTLSIKSINTRNFPVVAQQVASYFISKKILEPIHILTRLDADTSGCMLFAKDSFTHSKLSKQQEKGLITKKYQCVCFGSNLTNEIIDAPIGRDESSLLKRKIDLEHGKSSQTKIINVTELKNDFKLVEMQLLTGRTHQIRVHLAHKGNKIVGDDLYGENKIMPRQLLHCSQITYFDVETGEKRTINAPLKLDMKTFIANN